jgi:lipopolysaccharide export system permease protein
MRVIQRYFTSEITRSVLFALAAFLALFAFFEMMGQLEQVGRNGYKLQQAVFYVLMGLPGNVYELMPTAVLIGTIYTLSQLAARSEFTIMRASSMSTRAAAAMVFKVGILFVLVAFVFGELITPRTAPLARSTRPDDASASNSSLSLRSSSTLLACRTASTDALRGAAGLPGACPQSPCPFR